jgi:prepilin-type N-terminal cleavage/methylation domain-containing protein/prepilin-type processing-associated H-X9-DG protein
MSGGKSKSGFTLIELLAVVAIILLLLSLLVPALSSARERTYRAVCASNMRQLQLGHTQYSADHSGTMPGSETGSGGAKDWAIVTLGYDTLDSLTSGSIWPYVKNDKVYRCPVYPPALKDYFRNYSISGYLNGSPANWGYPTAVSSAGVHVPASTISFVEEPDPRKYLMGSWVTYMDVPRLNQWVDPVGFWHDGGANYAFLDGHTEYWRWEDARTMLIQYSFFVSQPNSPDLHRVKKHVAPGDPAYQVFNDLL